MKNEAIIVACIVCLIIVLLCFLLPKHKTRNIANQTTQTEELVTPTDSAYRVEQYNAIFDSSKRHMKSLVREKVFTREEYQEFKDNYTLEPDSIPTKDDMAVIVTLHDMLVDLKNSK
jgi:hypothetical protein